MFVTHLLLQERLANPDLLLDGDYLPLEVVGEHARHVFAFARRTGDKAMIVVAPRLPRTFRDATGSGFEVGAAWGDTAVVLPADFQECEFCSIFTAAVIQSRRAEEGSSLALRDLLDGFPLALLERS